jgi:TPR repeat protein
MKSNRLLILTLLLCFVFPVSSYADRLKDANLAIENEDYKTAYELLLPLAEGNNLEAQTLLGTLYVNGQGVEKDVTKGLSWIMKAATQGYDAAKVRALALCVVLAKDGDPKAMYNVGYMCLKEWGGKQDTNDCIEWLENAAKAGHIRSSKVLSQIYTKGMFGITPDEEKASYWSHFKASSDAGNDGK